MENKKKMADVVKQKHEKEVNENNLNNANNTNITTGVYNVPLVKVGKKAHKLDKKRFQFYLNDSDLNNAFCEFMKKNSMGETEATLYIFKKFFEKQ